MKFIVLLDLFRRENPGQLFTGVVADLLPPVLKFGGIAFLPGKRMIEHPPPVSCFFEYGPHLIRLTFGDMQPVLHFIDKQFDGGISLRRFSQQTRLPHPYFFQKFVQLFLLLRRQMLFHLGARLVENLRYLLPCFPAHFDQIMGGLLHNARDRPLLLRGEADLTGEPFYDQLRARWSELFTAHHFIELALDVQAAPQTANQDAGKEENRQPGPYFPFFHNGSPASVTARPT